MEENIVEKLENILNDSEKAKTEIISIQKNLISEVKKLENILSNSEKSKTEIISIQKNLINEAEKEAEQEFENLKYSFEDEDEIDEDCLRVYLNIDDEIKIGEEIRLRNFESDIFSCICGIWKGCYSEKDGLYVYISNARLDLSSLYQFRFFSPETLSFKSIKLF